MPESFSYQIQRLLMFWSKIASTNASALFSALKLYCIHFGLSAVALYHSFCGDLFFSTAAEDATSLEWVGNQLLSPTHYLLCGRKALPSHLPGPAYTFTHRFQYDDSLFWPKTAASIALIPLSLPLGVLCKAAAFSKETTRQRHHLLYEADTALSLQNNRDHYFNLGVDIKSYSLAEEAPCQKIARRPGDEKNLAQQKEALKVISKVLIEHEVPFWADCGTCLGAFRHGGVIPWDEDIDLAILIDDFDNVRKLLINHLDQERFQVQDWSSRDKPKTYLKVYIRGADSIYAFIDLYHYEIDAEKQQLRYLLSNADNVFLLESWRVREARYEEPVPIDMIFPLKMGQFDGIALPMPNRCEEYLKARYGENISAVRLYNPETDQYEPDLNHPYLQRSYVY